MGDVSNSDNRPLSYPLRFPLVNAGETPNDGTPQQISWPDIPNDERINVTIQVSLDEYVALASSVDVGRDIAYGDDTELIWWIWNRAIIMDICTQIADCISNQESATSQAIQQWLQNNGYSANFRDVSNAYPLLTPSAQAENLIPSDFDCSDAQIMALSRKIVQELNQSTEDLLQVIELVTSSVELAEIITQYIPIVGIYVEFASWIYDTLVEFYQASYDQAVEDELACALYCIAIEDCELSLDDMLSVYESSFVAEITPPSSVADVLSILEWASEVELAIGLETVAMFHWTVLQLMRFGGGLQGFVGISDLKSTIKTVRGWSDYSYEDCECAPTETPTDYWMIYQDFSLGSGAWTIQANNGIQQADGIMSQTNGSITAVVCRIDDLGDSFACKAAGVLNQRRGSTGSGSQDYDRIMAFPGTNLGGTPQDIAYHAFIECNANDCTTQEALTGTQPARSIRLQAVNGGAQNYPANFVKSLKLVVYGICNTGQIKPAQAVYIDSIPPAGTYFD
jgi:hypothetical protein